MIRWLAQLRGWILRKWLFLYLDLQIQTGNINKVNVLLSRSNLTETRLILRRMGAHIADSATIDTHLLIHNAPKLYSTLFVEEHVYIGKDCFLDLADTVRIEENATLAPRVSILTHFDAGQSFARSVFPTYASPVHIARGAYLGIGTIVLPGITIGEGAMVAAGSVVTQDVSPYVLVGGVPAKLIRSLSE